MRLPTFAHHAPKAFEELVKIKGDSTGSALMMGGGAIVFRGPKSGVKRYIPVIRRRIDPLLERFRPSSYRHTVIKEYYQGYAQRHSTSQVWPKNRMGLRACVSH